MWLNYNNNKGLIILIYFLFLIGSWIQFCLLLLLFWENLYVIYHMYNRPIESKIWSILIVTNVFKNPSPDMLKSSNGFLRNIGLGSGAIHPIPS